MGLAIPAFVLALLGNLKKVLNLSAGDGIIADKFVKIAVITVQILPSKDLLTTDSDLNTKM